MSEDFEHDGLYIRKLSPTDGYIFAKRWDTGVLDGSDSLRQDSLVRQIALIHKLSNAYTIKLRSAISPLSGISGVFRFRCGYNVVPNPSPLPK